jgi:hypothetical protein
MLKISVRYITVILSVLAVFIVGCSAKWATRVEQADFRSQVLSAPLFVSAAKLGYSVAVAPGVPAPNFSAEDKIRQAFALYFDGNGAPVQLSSANRGSVDGELRFTITMLKERVGDRLSAVEPAQLGFSVDLLRAGSVAWHGDFYVKDHAVTENLYRLSYSTKGGIRWRSAEELAAYGFELAAKDISESRRGLLTEKR